MPTLEHNRLVFRFPQIEEEACFSIDFQRTLRISDSDETYPLPPGLGSFPFRHVEDHKDKLPAQTTSRGGVILPMRQAEAMWLNFSNQGPGWDLAFPVAIKVAAGKINAVIRGLTNALVPCQQTQTVDTGSLGATRTATKTGGAGAPARTRARRHDAKGAPC